MNGNHNKRSTPGTFGNNGHELRIDGTELTGTEMSEQDRRSQNRIEGVRTESKLCLPVVGILGDSNIIITKFFLGRATVYMFELA